MQNQPASYWQLIIHALTPKSYKSYISNNFPAFAEGLQILLQLLLLILLDVDDEVYRGIVPALELLGGQHHHLPPLLQSRIPLEYIFPLGTTAKVLQVVVLERSVHLTLRHEFELIDELRVYVEDHSIPLRPQISDLTLQLLGRRVDQITIALLRHEMRLRLEGLLELLLERLVLQFQEGLLQLVRVAVVLEQQVEPLHVFAHPQLVHVERTSESHHLQGVTRS